MRFTSFLENGKLTVALTGEIDHHCAKNYIQAITGKIEAYTPDICVLDFRDVTFVDSSGIAVVINALRCMTKLGGELLLEGLSEQPLRIFKMAGIEKLVKQLQKGIDNLAKNGKDLAEKERAYKRKKVQKDSPRSL